MTPAELRKMAAMMEAQQQYGAYQPTPTKAKKKRKHNSAPARSGWRNSALNFALAASLLFLVAVFVRSEISTTAPANAETVKIVDQAELDAKYNAAEAVRMFLESPAYNYNGEEVGTVEQAIRRYGCGGFYKPLCKEAARLEELAAGGAS